MAFGTFTSLNSKLVQRFTIILFLFMSTFSFAATVTSVGSGNWNTAGTWDSGVPGVGDDVIIANTHTVTMDVAPSVTSVTVNSGGILDVNANTLTLSGALLINGDVTDGSGGGTVNIGGDFTINSGGTFNDNANGISVDFNGSGIQTLSGTYGNPSLEFFNFTVSGSGTVDNNLSTEIILSGQFFQSAGTFQAGASTITLGYSALNGNTFDKSGGTFTAETAVLSIKASVNIRMRIDASTSFYSIVHAPPTGARTLSLDETNAGSATYTITNSLSLEPNSNGVNFLNGAVLAYSGTTTLSYSTNNSLTLGNEWPTTSSPTNVTVNSTGTMTLGTSRTVSGTFTQTGGGTFDVSGGTLTINGTFSKGSGSFTTSAGALAYGTSALLSYTATQTAGVEWKATVPNVTISSGTVTISGTAGRTISNVLTVSSTLSAGGNALTVGDGAGTDLVVNGSLSSTANVSTTSDASLGSSASLNTGNGNFSSAALTLASGATLTTGTGTSTMTGAVSLGHLSTISTTSTATVEGSLSMGAGTATVGTSTAGELIMGGSGTSAVTLSNGNIEVFNFTVNKSNAAEVTVTGSGGSQIRFNANGTLRVTDGTLAFSESGQVRDIAGTTTISDDNLTLRVDANGTLSTGGTDLSGFQTFTLADGSTVNFSGSIAEDIPAATYGNLTVSNTHSSGASAIGTLVFQTNSTVSVTGTSRLNLGGQTITNSGLSDALSVASGASLYTDGASLEGFATNTINGTVHFNGSSQETSPSTAFVANNIEVDNGAGLVVGTGDMTVTGTLTFTNGKITSTTSDLLTLGVSATATPTSSSFVTGPVAREADGAATSFAFPVGNGTNLRTVTLSSVSPAPAGTETITVEANGTASGATSADVDVKSVEDDGYWTITPSGGVSGATTYTANFTTAGFSPSITASSSVTMVKGTTPNFDTQGTSESSGTDFVQADFTGFSDFAVGNLAVTYTFDGSSGSNWSTAANWDQNAEPGDGDVVVIPNGFTVTYDASVTASNYASVDIQGSSSLSLDATSFNLSGTSLSLGTGTLTFNGASITNYSAANTTYGSGSTVQFNIGTVQADTYHHLIINTTGTLSSSGTVTVAGNFTKSGSGTYSSGGTLDIAGTTTLNGGTVTPGGTTTLAGNIVGGGGSFDTGSGTVTLDGSGSAQTISGTSITFNNLTLSNTSGLSLSQSPTVEGVFTFAVDALVTTGSNHLLIGQAGSISGASSARYVSGRLAREYPTGATTFTYPTGKGGEYLPLTLNFSSLTAGYTRVVEQINSDANGLDPDVDAGLSKVSGIRYWEVSRVGSSGGIGGNITMTLNYNANDQVDTDATELDVAQLSTDVNGDAGSIGVWQSIGGNGSGTGVGSITSTAFTSGGDFYTFGDAAGGVDNSLPVELTSFEAIAEMDKVTLKWVTESETENFGFNVFKKLAAEEEWAQVNDELIAGQGNTSTATGYEFVDFSVRSGDIYSYRLESVSISGIINVEKIIEIEVPVPDKFVLFNNYPNPFNPVTNLKFQLPEQSKVSLVVYDITGKVVKNLVKDANYDVGQHVVVWDATNQSGAQVSSGLYLYRFTADKYSKMGRMILLK